MSDTKIDPFRLSTPLGVRYRLRRNHRPYTREEVTRSPATAPASTQSGCPPQKKAASPTTASASTSANPKPASAAAC